MARWEEALRAYRRRSLEPAPGAAASDVMFVLCSECHAGAELVASMQPAMVLQTLGGAGAPADPAVRATFEYAVRSKGVRRIVLCGHEGCQAVAEGGRAASQAHVVSQLRSLLDDEEIGPVLRARRVKLRALWFDEREGDVYACDVEGRPAALLDDEDLARMFTDLDEARNP
jgi:carbonic anhydrase